MKVIVFVEGPSDKSALQALLRPLIELKRQEGVAIEFFDSPSGDKKETLLVKVPRKAVNILLNEPDSFVVAMPDLYPKNKAFPHETFAEMLAGIRENFTEALKVKGHGDDRLKNRFKVFCFKHDLEALVLASGDALKARLGVKSLDVYWHEPVEDQNHDKPPKRIIEELFRKQGKLYKETVDAPLILGNSNYQDVARNCFQCFKPFVDFLEGVHT